MDKIVYSEEFFNIKDTLTCGQIFRFKPFKKGFLVFSCDKCAYSYNENGNAVVECCSQDKEYFYNFFDLARDYSTIYNESQKSEFEVLRNSAHHGKGIRILNQDIEETSFSFIISQNNNIPKIKSTIEKICTCLGEKRQATFENEMIEYYSFPNANKIANTSLEILKTLSLGYRAEYIKRFAENIENGFSLVELNKLSTKDLWKELVKIYGIGAKVANCLLLFGYHRSDSFPVDVWIKRVYQENFNGKLTNTAEITNYFIELFGDNAGYFQQYLFFNKISLEKQFEKDKK